MNVFHVEAVDDCGDEWIGISSVDVVTVWLSMLVVMVTDELMFGLQD